MDRLALFFSYSLHSDTVCHGRPIIEIAAIIGYSIKYLELTKKQTLFVSLEEFIRLMTLKRFMNRAKRPGHTEGLLVSLADPEDLGGYCKA